MWCVTGGLASKLTKICFYWKAKRGATLLGGRVDRGREGVDPEKDENRPKRGIVEVNRMNEEDRAETNQVSRTDEVDRKSDLQSGQAVDDLERISIVDRTNEADQTNDLWIALKIALKIVLKTDLKTDPKTDLKTDINCRPVREEESPDLGQEASANADLSIYFVFRQHPLHL